MTSQWNSPNINERMLGLREGLSGRKNASLTEKLNGRWKEIARCPWKTTDNAHQALQQLQYTLDNLDVDMFIALGFWPQENALEYRKVISPFKKKILKNSKTTLIISGATRPQLELLRDGLAHVNITPDFAEMGREVYRQLKKLHMGDNIAEYIFTPIWHVDKTNVDIRIGASEKYIN